jgi:3-methyladenine DNA glycosylase AlkC
MAKLEIPDAPMSIQKGVPLKLILDKKVINQLAINLHTVHNQFDMDGFIHEALADIEPLSLTERAKHIAEAMHRYLPSPYSEAIEVINKSLTPPLDRTEANGLAPMFYMPHSSFIAAYGVDKAFNDGVDPFDISMQSQYELTKRFTCEFAIRHFIINEEDRTMNVLYKWMTDRDPHVRRLTSEGSRPRLPWAMKIDSFVKDPSPCIPILELLKDDEDQYVRRSVANHVGDIAKDNMDMALDLCEKWLNGASTELKWVIRHALRNPYKKGIERAIAIRKAAK